MPIDFEMYVILRTKVHALNVASCLLQIVCLDLLVISTKYISCTIALPLTTHKKKIKNENKTKTNYNANYSSQRKEAEDALGNHGSKSCESSCHLRQNRSTLSRNSFDSNDAGERQID